MRGRRRWLIAALDRGVWALLLAVWAAFGLLSDDFLTASNLSNVLVQASSVTILTVGMTFVLLTAGVDLSVGSIMLLAAAAAGKLAVAGWPFSACLLAMVAAGLAAGLINAALITRLGVIPFVATLGTLYVGRGVGLWATETRAINLPPDFLAMGSARLLGVPLPIVLTAAVAAAGQLALSRTIFGQHVLAVGHDAAAAEKAGVATRRVLAAVYAIAGLSAALAASVSLGQLGAVSPTFGENREFTAIAAAVVGGTSLFGGRGSVFPGAVLGAVLIQSIDNGLNLLNADPYLYPIVVSGIIFAAVLLDGVRTSLLRRLQRRPIFTDDGV